MIIVVYRWHIRNCYGWHICFRCHQIICKRKDQKTETHLLSDDEVDELAVLLGINLYSTEDHRIFITEMTRVMIEGAEYLTMEKN